MIMFVNFGMGKCPMCGDFGKKIQKDNFSCRKCSLMFDKFYVSFLSEPQEQNSFWN